MKRIKKLSVLLAVLAFSLTTALVGAQVVVSTAIYQSLFSVTNSSIATTNEVVGFPFSGYTLVDQNFMDADTLNSVVTDTFSTGIPAMPPSTRLAYQSAKQDDGGVFTTYTTEINNPSVFDVDFFPATPAVSDAFYFGLNSPGRILPINVGVAGEYDYTIVWEYYDGSTWASLANVEDGTDSFETAGIGLVSFDLPLDMSSTVIDTVTSYWVRARVDTFTSVTTSVIGTQAWWETGTWFVYVDSLGESVQTNYTLFMGGATDLVTNQQIFPGAAGIITTDDPAIEIGGTAFSIILEGAFDVDSTSGNYLTKTNAITIDNPASGEIRVTIDDGVGTSTASVTGVASGEFTITVSSDGVTLTIAVLGVGSASTTMLSIADNANDWVWGDGDTTLYFEEVSITFPSVLEDWNVSGSFGENGTFTDAIEFLDTSIYTSIGTPAIAPTGSTFHGGNLWIVDSNDLYEIDETDATSTISNCVLVDTGAVAVTSDGTNLWYVSTVASDVIEINTSCVLQSQFDISAVSAGINSIAYNTDISRLAVFSTISTDPTISIYQTGGTQDSSNAITAMDLAGDVTILAAEYYDGFYYVSAWHSTSEAYSLWKMTDHTDATPVYRIHPDMYGWGSIIAGGGSILPIQPGNLPWAFQDLTIDPATGNVWSYPGLVTSIHSVIYQEYLTYTFDGILTAHVRSGNNYQQNIPGWSNIPDVSSRKGGLDTTSPYSGTYGVVFSVNASGSVSTVQTVTGFVAGNVYSFGVLVICGAETNLLSVTWKESDGTPIGSALEDSIFNTCAPWSQLAINNETAPPLATQATITIRHSCSGFCGNPSYSFWDGVQAIKAIAVESFPTTTTNLVVNPSFEMIYETGEYWTSDSLSLGTVTDVASSIISWDETLPDDSTLLVETSINAGGLWTTATNGAAIPLIIVGNDLTGISLLVRVTLNPSTDQEDTAQLDSMQLSILDTSDFTLKYSLNDIPSLTIADRVGSNNGAMSFPLPTNTSLTAAAGPLVTIAGAINVSGDASTPDFVDEITPGDITSATILSNDIPLNDLWIALSALSNGDVPPIMFWVITAMVVILASGSYTFLYTASVPWTAGVMGMFTLGFVNFGGGVIPFWVFFFFGIMAMATSIFSKVKAM